MGRTKEITGCIFLNHLSPARGMAAIHWLIEANLSRVGQTAIITDRMRQPGETGTGIIMDCSMGEALREAGP